MIVQQSVAASESSPGNLQSGHEMTNATHMNVVDDVGEHHSPRLAAAGVFHWASPSWPSDSPYGGSLHVVGSTRAAPQRHAHCDGGEFSVEEVTLPKNTRVDVTPDADALIVEVVSGDLRCAEGDGRTGVLTDGDSVIAAPGLPLSLISAQARVRIVVLAASLLRRIAGEQAPTVVPITLFQHRRPRSHTSAETWARTSRYVLDTLGSSDAVPALVLVDACARVLASAALTTFTDSARIERLPADDAQTPVQLKRALWFINAKVEQDIGIQEIADAVHLSPRAVQYLFRRHLDATPTEYVRRIRLHRAHQDLVASSSGIATVSSIAIRWGFAHTGRFAVLYRETFGQSPHQTLRG